MSDFCNLIEQYFLIQVFFKTVLFPSDGNIKAFH